MVGWGQKYMRIDSEELRRRLSSSKNLAVALNTSAGSTDRPSNPAATNPSNVEHRTKGKPHRGPEVPEELREAIGTLASLPGSPTQEVIGSMFGFDQRQVSNFKTGRASSTSAPPTEERRAAIQKRQENIKDAALLRVMECLNLLGPEKLEDCSAKDLSRISVDMAKVSASFDTDKEKASNINIVVYTPETRKESSYKVIEV